METKEEIITKLFDYLDSAIMSGFFTETEVKEIYLLEQKYNIQSIEMGKISFPPDFDEMGSNGFKE